jgi:DNA-binding transcriptional regulator PaaX
MRPDNLDLGPELTGHTDLEVFVARTTADPADLTRRLWDLDAWATGARDLRRRLERSPTSGPDRLATGFELSAAVLRHLQADPMLPPELLPARWPGADLRQSYDRWDRRYRDVLRAWGRTRSPA